MEHTDHVLIVDPDVAFLERYGLEVVERDYFITEPRKQQLDHIMDGRAIAARHGTVGAVARDAGGRVAAATSTGGMAGQAEGRVGDTPIVGAGVYARDNVVAISCTGARRGLHPRRHRVRRRRPDPLRRRESRRGSQGDL